MSPRTRGAVPWVMTPVEVDGGAERPGGFDLRVLTCGDLGAEDEPLAESLRVSLHRMLDDQGFQHAVFRWVRSSDDFFRCMTTQLPIDVPMTPYQVALWPRTVCVVLQGGKAELTQYWTVQRDTEDVTIPRTRRAVEAFAAFQRFMTHSWSHHIRCEGQLLTWILDDPATLATLEEMIDGFALAGQGEDRAGDPPGNDERGQRAFSAACTLASAGG